MVRSGGDVITTDNRVAGQYKCSSNSFVDVNVLYHHQM